MISMVVLTRQNKKTKQTIDLVLLWECKQLFPKGHRPERVLEL